MIEPVLSPVEKRRTGDLLLEIAARQTPGTTAARLAGRFFRSRSKPAAVFRSAP